MPRGLLSLVVSAVQSEVFNRVLAARLDRIDTVVEGDLAFLHRNGAVFLVRDVAVEQARCDAFELSPSGPLPGPEMRWPEGPAAEIERVALASLEIDADLFGRMPRDSHEGARRPLRMRVQEVAVDAEAADVVRLRFVLDRGSYATAVLHELLVEPTPPAE
jgi:tRNA pseudouridine13 synthase